MNRGNSHYLAYLLRMWQIEEGGPWRVSLQGVESGERQGFADIEKLVEFLKEQTRQTPRDGGGDERG